MLEGAQKCDVMVTSGGVSMGDADYIKAILQELGQVCEET
jgi:molybdopterin biosynthesis enzyme